MADPYKYEPSARDWTEDFEHENGNYFGTCRSCSKSFLGHKRRITCKLCSAPPTPEAEVLDRFARWSGWPEPPRQLQTMWYDIDALAKYVVELEQKLADHNL